MEIGRTFEPSSRSEWRQWLEQNHRTETEIWLVSYSKASGKATVAYGEAVEEALCFGWIDSTNKKHGPDSHA